ncbi:MAG: hypothetical protein JJT78_03745 [Leptospira sp.]|nr:hypothetical protein [Leptospira sp.]
MKIASTGLIVFIFSISINCSPLDFFRQKSISRGNTLASYYTSPSFRDFNPQFYSEESIFKIFMNIRQTSQDSRVDKTEITIIKYNPEFRIAIEKHFPEGAYPSYRIETKIITGQMVGNPGPTGFEVLYTTERIRAGEGASLDSAWNNFNKSAYTRTNIKRSEKWETIKDGLWLSEEAENFDIGSLVWKHKPGSLDFFHPITEFKSNNNISASLYYDYNLNRYEKLSIEKKPDSSNLVFEGENASLYFVDGQLTIRYNQ